MQRSAGSPGDRAGQPSTVKSRLASLGFWSLVHFQALNGLFIQPLGVHAGAREFFAQRLDGEGWLICLCGQVADIFEGINLCAEWLGGSRHSVPATKAQRRLGEL